MLAVLICLPVLCGVMAWIFFCDMMSDFDRAHKALEDVHRELSKKY